MACILCFGNRNLLYLFSLFSKASSLFLFLFPPRFSQDRWAAQTSGASDLIPSPTKKCDRQISVVKFVMFHGNLSLFALTGNFFKKKLFLTADLVSFDAPPLSPRAFSPFLHFSLSNSTYWLRVRIRRSSPLSLPKWRREMSHLFFVSKSFRLFCSPPVSPSIWRLQRALTKGGKEEK